MSDNRHEQGMRVRRGVLGDAHVDRAEKNKTPFDARFQDYITESAWGTVWNDETISFRDRSLVTIALLAALGHHEELVMHIRATLNTGVTQDEIREVLMHVGLYAGVPNANQAFAIAKQIFADWEKEI